MDPGVSAARWVVGKALSPVTDGLVEAWAASSELGTNVSALKMELLYAQGMLDNAQCRETRSPALKLLLQELWQLAFNAEDVLDELDYFRIQDELDGTSEAANEHAKGSVHNLFLNAHHTAKAVASKLKCSPRSGSANLGDPDESEEDEDEHARNGAISCVWPYVARRARRSAPSLLPKPVDDGTGRRILFGARSFRAPEEKRFIEAPKMKFYRVEMSNKMKIIIENLQPLCAKVSTILNLELLESTRRPASELNSRTITTPEIEEPKFYGREDEIRKIKVIIEGNNKDLTVLPVVGLGGIGKTALAKHIYNYKELDKYFDLKIWICVSFNFSVSILTHKIAESISKVKDNEENTSPENLIENTLNSKRFLLVLDDMWSCGSKNEWNRLLAPLKKGNKKGNIILVTSRSPALAKMVKTTDHSIELESLGDDAFKGLFLACVFGDNQSINDHEGLAQIGDDIVKKLKGSPLAAKTVGRLLRNNLNVEHWRNVLESKEWELQTGDHEIMPALKLSYKYLPFHLQQCFSFCALFPKNYMFDGKELINLWIGLGILQSSNKTKRVEDIGLCNLNDLVSHGFFKKDETGGHPCYLIHDLLHDLALMVASHECLSIDCCNVRSVEIWPSVRHLSITIDAAQYGDAKGNFRRDLKKLKTRLEVENLQTLMLFGEFDERFANIIGDLFREANALRVLCLPRMSLAVEAMLHNFSRLIHLRYLKLGSKQFTSDQMQLPRTLSRFYHLRILDLQTWDGCCDLPKDMSNLAKLRHVFTEKDELHANIYNVGKLQLLQELKRYCVKNGGGFELKQLGHMNELRELGIYNLENTHTKEAATKAKLIDKRYLRKLTLHWGDERCPKPDVEAMVLESLEPNSCLQELSIRCHGGLCPTWLRDNTLSVKALQSLHLVGVAWEVLPSFSYIWELRELTLENIVTINEFVLEQSFRKLRRLTVINLQGLRTWKAQDCNHLFPLLQDLIIKNCPKLLKLPFIDNICYSREQDVSMPWLPNLKKFEIESCQNISSFPPIPWTQTLCSVSISDVGSELLESLEYDQTSSEEELKIIGKDGLHSLDEVLVFNNLTTLQQLDMEECPPLDTKFLVMLTSMKNLMARGSESLFVPLTSLGDKWELPVEQLEIWDCHANGKELSQLLSHFPKLSTLEIGNLNKITLVSSEDINLELSLPCQHQENREEIVEDYGFLQLPFHICRSLLRLEMYNCPQLMLAAHLPLNGHKAGLQALSSLRELVIISCPMVLSEYSSLGSSCYPFPTSVQDLTLEGVVVNMMHLSNLTLTRLYLKDGGDNLRCKDLAQDQLSKLVIYQCPEFFVGWGLQDERDGLIQRSSKLQQLLTDDLEGILVKPICSLISSSLTDLGLQCNDKVKCFTKEQEEAFQLLTSLQELRFFYCEKLQHLPEGIHMLTNLKRLEINSCPFISSLPVDPLPSSLQVLDVRYCENEKVKQQCRKLKGTIPNTILLVDAKHRTPMSHLYLTVEEFNLVK